MKTLEITAETMAQPDAPALPVRPILHTTDDNPVPERASVAYFDGANGKKLRYAIFRSDAKLPAKGTVVLLQGRNECIEKYFETIAEFTARGLWVATFDWRGQGGSDRLLKNARRGHTDRFSDYETDLASFLEKVVLPDTRLPFFMVAHSMGALVALSHAPRMDSRIDRLAVLAPFVGLGGQALGKGLISLMAGCASFTGLGFLALGRDRPARPFADNLLTSDERRFARNRAFADAHPHLGLDMPSARWLHEAFRAMRRVSSPQHLTKIRLPTIVLAPTRDTLVPHSAVEQLARNFRAGTMIPIDGARHELLQEADHYRAQAMAAIEAFIPGTTGEPLDVEAVED